MTRVSDLGLTCQWFARCERPAAGVVSHPVLGYVPTCQPCAAMFDLDLVDAEVTNESNDSCCDNNGKVD